MRQNLDLDQIARKKIRHDVHSNFFVEAGAGSGKTSVLVDRMAAMVEEGMDISKICAITFTKAAAGEFYARFYKKLSESKSKNAQAALRDIDLCFMGTIDSFCNMVLSEHPAAAGIPSDAAVLDEKAETEAYLREYSKILSGNAGSKELYEKAKRFQRTFYNPKEIFLSGIRRLSSVKNAEFVYQPPMHRNLDDALRTEKERILFTLNFLAQHEEFVPVEKAKKVRQSWDALLDGIEILNSDWEDNLSSVRSVLKKLGDLRIRAEFADRLDELGIGWDNLFVPHASKGKITWYEIDREGDPLLLEKLSNQAFSIAADFLSACMKPISETLRKEGKLTFADYLLYLRNLLQEDAAAGGKLIAHIYDRHSYFLIDEFQDTDPIQAEIFFYLTAQKPQANWKACVPKPGSLFVVGDPKQSIYRFKGADVSSFLRVRTLFENPDVGEVLFLTRNFRSSDNLCGWFNEVFTALLPEDSSIQSRFHEIPTGDKETYRATLEGTYSYEVPSYRNLNECMDYSYVAEIIRNIVENPEITIQGREKGSKPRRPSYSDFMVITPTKSHLPMYMKAMLALGVPFKVEGKASFDECPAIRTLSYLMSAAADPFDKKAMFAAVNISGVEISEAEIFDYAKRAKQMSPVSLFQTLLDEKRIFMQAGTENAEYVYFALELLRSAEAEGAVASISEGAAYISELVNSSGLEERCIQLKRDSNRVHIANLHKVKGLEAPIVILADPKNAKNRAPEQHTDYAQDPPKTYMFSLGYSDKSTDFADKKAFEQEILDAEKRRLLYVAATRAENALIVSAALSKEGELLERNVWRPFILKTDRDIFKTIGGKRPLAENEKKSYDTAELYEEGETSCVLKDHTQAAASYQINKPSTVIYKGITSSSDDFEDKAEDELTKIPAVKRSKQNPLLLGTMAHHILEALVSSRNLVNREALITETMQEYQIDAPECKEILGRVIDVIRDGGCPQKNGAPQDILTELLNADEVYCELPFCCKEEKAEGEKTNIIWHGVMDVVYRKGNHWHIVDYKTNADADDLDERYSAQLDAYVKAFQEMTGEAADAMIYHLDV